MFKRPQLNLSEIKDKMSNAANVSQLYSLYLLLQDASNDQIMKELSNQNEAYLKKIIEQNEEIIRQNEEMLDILKEMR